MSRARGGGGDGWVGLWVRASERGMAMVDIGTGQNRPNLQLPGEDDFSTKLNSPCFNDTLLSICISIGFSSTKIRKLTLKL